MTNLVGRVKAYNNKAFILINDKEEYNVSKENVFFPIKENDSVSVDVRKRDGIYVITGNYFAVIPIDDTSVSKYIEKTLMYNKLGIRVSSAFIAFLKMRAGKKILYQYIDSIAWSMYKKTHLYTQLEGEVKKIMPEDKFSSFLNRWLKERNQRSLWLLGLPNKIIYTCSLPWAELYQLCLDNPFKVPEIPMTKAAEICKKLRVEIKDKDLAAGAAIRLVYNNMLTKGWTYTPKNILLKHVEAMEDEEVFTYTVKNYDLVEDKERIYLTSYHKIEVFLADYLKEAGEAKREIKNVKLEDKKLSEDQKEAITSSLARQFSFILGPAGSGKTTIIKELIKYFKDNKFSFALMAYTGKATMRISQVTKEKASTIHMYINRNVDYSPDYVIIDEVSMVTNELLYRLIKTFNPSRPVNIICLGDPNQLLPIEAGFFLGQVIKSGIMPIYYLTKNHRCNYEGKDGIYLNANAICTGKFDKFIKADNFIHYGTGEDILSKLLQTLKDNEVKAEQLIILSPYKDLESINEIGQEIFTPKNEVFETYHIGDPVICTKNLYELDIFNGEQGIIKSIDTQRGKVCVKFERKEVTFKKHVPSEGKESRVEEEEEDNLNNISLSYAVTVHRSQGSEWDYVIFYLPPKAVANPKFINRNLIYTAITRAKLGVFIIGSLDTFNKGAKLGALERLDHLSSRLTGKEEKEVDIEEREDDICFDPEDYI